MPALVIAAVVALGAPAPLPALKTDACAGTPREAAAAPAPAAPHILADEPGGRRMHAVLRRMGGCVVIDVSTVRSGVQGWEYRLAGPDRAWPRPAASDGR